MDIAIERLFRDAFSHTTGYYTIDDEYLTIFIGKETVEDNLESDMQNVVQVYGPNQKKIAELIEKAFVNIDESELK